MKFTFTYGEEVERLKQLSSRNFFGNLVFSSISRKGFCLDYLYSPKRTFVIQISFKKNK